MVVCNLSAFAAPWGGVPQEERGGHRKRSPKCVLSELRWSKPPRASGSRLPYLPAECVYPKATFYTKLAIKTLGPLFACLALWMPVLWLLVMKVRLNMFDKHNQARRERLGQRMQYWSTMATYLSTLLLEIILPSVSTTIAQTFMCAEIGGERFLRQQLTISCERSAERSWWLSYGIGMGVIYPVRAAAPSIPPGLHIL